METLMLLTYAALCIVVFKVSPHPLTVDQLTAVFSAVSP